MFRSLTLDIPLRATYHNYLEFIESWEGDEKINSILKGAVHVKKKSVYVLLVTVIGFLRFNQPYSNTIFFFLNFRQ